MRYQTYVSYSAELPYYIRFTCEKCGCKTHWIQGEISVSTGDQGDVGTAMAKTVERLRRELDDCCNGKRMLVGDDITLAKGVCGYFGETKCPKCGEIQSWAPRMAKGFTTKRQQKNADAFNATPVLSKPEVVFGGEMPAPDGPDFEKPCRLEIHGSSFGVPHASPVYLNGVKVGETDQNSIDISVDTYYRDNLIVIYQRQWTSYVEAEEGRTLNLKYSNFMVRKA